MLRLGGRRARRGAGRALREPEQLREAIPAAWPRSSRRPSPNGAIWANQFDNVANRQAHIETTGPEIWEQTDGKVDGFICAVGSGGTLAGVGMALKARKPGRDDRPRRPAGRGALQLLHARRAEGRGHLDHRGHRPGPDHRQPRGRARSTTPSGSPTRRCCRSVFDLLRARRAGASAARRASTSPAPIRMAARARARATPS